MPKVIQLIYSEDRRGNGTEEDPSRMVAQLHTLQGDLIAEQDAYLARSFLLPRVRDLNN